MSKLPLNTQTIAMWRGNTVVCDPTCEYPEEHYTFDGQIFYQENVND